MASRSKGLILGVGLCTFLTAGCSSGAAAAPVSASTAPASAPPTVPASVAPQASPSGSMLSTAPLTNASISPGVATRAVVAVPVVVAPGAAAPLGLSTADVVFETALGHNGLRLLALFQSRDPAQAGPVSSTIPSDAQVLAVLHPVLANTGGGAGFIKTLRASPVVDGSPARAPYGYQAAPKPAKNINAVPSLLRKAAGGQAVAPPPLLTFTEGSATDVNQSTAAHTVVVTTPGQLPEQWTYQPASRQWRRAGSISVSVTNLVLQVVPYENVLLHHPGKATVPVARALGTGSATVLLYGVAVKATWSKPGLADITNYTDATNLPVWFHPGSTWVSLLSTTSRITVR